VGYVIPGIKDVKAARVGDTWHLARQHVQPLPGFKPIKPMVFAGGIMGYCIWFGVKVFS
jgi:GTP-binding protein LepA